MHDERKMSLKWSEYETCSLAYTYQGRTVTITRFLNKNDWNKKQSFIVNPKLDIKLNFLEKKFYNIISLDISVN